MGLATPMHGEHIRVGFMTYDVAESKWWGSGGIRQRGASFIWLLIPKSCVSMKHESLFLVSPELNWHDELDLLISGPVEAKYAKLLSLIELVHTEIGFLAISPNFWTSFSSASWTDWSVRMESTNGSWSIKGWSVSLFSFLISQDRSAAKSSCERSSTSPTISLL